MNGRLAAMTGVRSATVQSYELSPPERSQVLMRVSMANICGSDIHMWEGNHIFRDHVLGHEMVGVIEALGPDVTTDSAGQPVAVGDRIVPVYYQTCRSCEACTGGHFNVCLRGSDFMGAPATTLPHFTGGFATHYIVQDKQYFYKVPDNVSDVVAAGANCGFTQMLYALDQVGPLGNRVVVVQGAGGVGLFTAAIASLMGARVTVIDSVEDRLREALQFGAEHVVSMSEYPTVADRERRVRELNGSAPELVVEVAGVPAAFDEALRLVAIGGTVLEIGNVSIDENRTASVLPGLITRKCITVRGILRYQPWYLARALELLSAHAHRFPFETLTDRVYTLDETQLALERAASREVARAAINPQASSHA